MRSSGNVGLENAVRGMIATLTHRGPDASGEWLDLNAGVALAHRRLSIIDLSPEGAQPMRSPCGRYVISFNGEIYNYTDIKHELRSCQWRGQSDTEVLLAAISVWGLERALSKIVGMFAFGLWDREERALHLVRDRLGEKPLYYGEVGQEFVFASELKALLTRFDARPRINLSALQGVMQFGYVPAPLSIYEGIHKLPAASRICVQVSPDGRRKLSEVTRYWNLPSPRTQSALASSTPEALEEQLYCLIEQSVRGQMVADVPLGAFLSGGVDSSTVVAVMQRLSSRPVRTFTIGFSEPTHDEAPYARKVAECLGTEHTELYVTPTEAAKTIPRIPTIFDEPFADSSQIPTFLVAQMTREFVTVSLSGDGGDELFAGYPRYSQGEQLWRRIHQLPRWGRNLCSHLLGSTTPAVWDRFLGVVLPRDKRRTISGHRLHRLSRVIKSNSLLDTYIGMVSQWQHEDALINGAPMPLVVAAAKESAVTALPLDQMRRFDGLQYLPDDILVKVDRACMSVSLESRAPLLDHRVVEFAFSLPAEVLVRDGQGKWLLRRVLDRFVPQNLTHRPKSGFGLPIGKWLREDLRPWAEALLSERSIRDSGFLRYSIVWQMWQEHLRGTHDRSAYLWNVLMFQAWLQEHLRASFPTQQLLKQAS